MNAEATLARSRTHISVHDISQEVYDLIGTEEIASENHRWKRVETPGSVVTYFAPRNGDGEEVQS